MHEKTAVRGGETVAVISADNSRGSSYTIILESENFAKLLIKRILKLPVFSLYLSKGVSKFRNTVKSSRRERSPAGGSWRIRAVTRRAFYKRQILRVFTPSRDNSEHLWIVDSICCFTATEGSFGGKYRLRNVRHKDA